QITPDEHGDWLKQRDSKFDQFVLIGNKKSSEITLFESYSAGIQTNRDAWAYNHGKSSLASNISRMIDFYNGEISRFKRAYPILQGKPSPELVNDFINRDPKFISWSSSLISSFSSSKIGSFDQSNLAISLSRPFSKQYLYFDGIFNHRTYQMPKIFPNSESKNLIIGLSGVGALNSFTVLISN